MSDDFTTESPFTEEQQKIIDKVEKLFRLAARNPNPEESASALEKGNALLAAHNLSQTDVNADEDKSAVREKLKMKGGMYEYQRMLYRAVSELNFCMYWCMMNREWKTRNKLNKWSGMLEPTTYLAKEFQHIIVGRLVNTRGTRIMAEYLRQTIERLVNDRYSNTQRWAAEAVAYREGIADTVCERLRDRRRTVLQQEKAKAEAERARAGVSTSQAVTIGSFTASERDANRDFLYGEGFSARQAKEAAERAEAQRRADEEYTQWAAANPQEARKLEEERRKERRKYRYSGGTGSRGGMSSVEKRQTRHGSSYYQGRDAGANISLDQQVDDRPMGAPKRIGRG